MREARVTALMFLFNHPIISIKNVSDHLGVSYNTAAQIMAEFLEATIVIQESKQKREKVFRFQPYLTLLEQDYMF